MSDKVPMPADGGGTRKGALDGVRGSPADGPGSGVSGRTDSGETGGGAYPNPHTGKAPGHRDHGGQTEMEYYGSGQAGLQGRSGPNAPAGSNDVDNQEAPVPPPVADRQPHEVQAGGRSFEVVEASGVAAAEASGRLQPNAADLPEDDSKLAG